MAESILIVDDEEIIRESLSFVLKKEGYSVQEAENGKVALEYIKERAFDLVITDIEMPEMKGIELMENISRLSPETMVVVITAYGSIESAIAALRRGAIDYVLKPVEFDELLVKTRRLLGDRRIRLENKLLRSEIHRHYDFENIIGKSSAMQRVFETIKKVAQTDGTVLITGKSGTGKELVARAVHYNSKRKEKPFIPVNCGALVENLFESELFGHKKGAFTGASMDRVGFFKTADGGTIFLDEVSEIPLHLQVKLLRAIEMKQVTPVGTSHEIPVDVRIIASTNRNLEKAVQDGKYREDLFYRLNVVGIELPPLSERIDDIPLLVQHFVSRYASEMNKDVRGVDHEAMKLLLAHNWKGEVRELENIIERATIFAEGNMITTKELPAFFGQSSGSFSVGGNKPLKEAVAEFEREYIGHMLRIHPSKDELAKALNISLSSLYRKIEELNIPSQS
ncbi:MAG: sigma-54-dependent Fis family transcriptional regulator [Bacteroidetes bacterium]|nr:sigma-54-dependent Fis family transcriptional regulator [Bacteroidota bacterium]MCW5895541.1 sigma-54-dependent Fis family transcriptional regulator [Bacteroidota bacterium]